MSNAPYRTHRWVWYPDSGAPEVLPYAPGDSGRHYKSYKPERAGRMEVTVWINGWVKTRSTRVHVGEANLELHVDGAGEDGDVDDPNPYTFTARPFPETLNGEPVSLQVLGWRREGDPVQVASSDSTISVGTQACAGTPNPCVTYVVDDGTMYVRALVNGVEKEANAPARPLKCPAELRFKKFEYRGHEFKDVHFFVGKYITADASVASYYTDPDPVADGLQRCCRCRSADIR